jgi:hypothetical protein
MFTRLMKSILSGQDTRLAESRSDNAEIITASANKRGTTDGHQHERRHEARKE